MCFGLSDCVLSVFTSDMSSLFPCLGLFLYLRLGELVPLLFPVHPYAWFANICYIASLLTSGICVTSLCMIDVIMCNVTS